MFRILTCLAGFLVVTAIPSTGAHAQAGICKKVKLTATCGNGDKVTTGGSCKPGETKGACCARALNGAFAACKLKGGVASYDCDCSKPKPGGMPLPGEESDTGGPAPADTPAQPEALPAGPIAPAARGAPATSCKKVIIGFACRRGGSGTVALPCRAGENEAQCCTRWKAKHTRPRGGLCQGRGGGLVSYKCSCPKQGQLGDAPGGLIRGRSGGPRPGLLRAPGPDGPKEPDTPTAPGVPGGPPAPPAPPEPPTPPEPGEPTTPAEPGLPSAPSQPGGTTGLPGLVPSGDREPPCVDRPGGQYRRYCVTVRIKYVCKSGGSGSRSFGCGKGQSQADCCRRAVAGLCGGKLDPVKTGKIQTACKCVKWSKWRKCRALGGMHRR